MSKSVYNKVFIRLAFVVGAAIVCFAAAFLFQSHPLAQTTKRYKPQLVVQSGHADEVSYTTFSPDGRFALTSDDRSAKLWDIATETELRDFGKPSEAVFSPDSRYLIDGVNLTDVATGVTKQIVATQTPVRGRVHSVISKDGTRFGFDAAMQVGVADMASGKTIFAGTGSYLAIDNGARLAASFGPMQSADIAVPDDSDPSHNYIYMTDTISKQMIRKIGPIDETPVQLIFAPDNSTLIVTTLDGFDVWNARTGSHIGKLPMSQLVLSYKISPIGDSIMWARYSDSGIENEVWFWRFDQPAATRLNSVEQTVWVPGYDYSPNGKIATVSGIRSDNWDSSRVYADLFDTNTGKPIRRIETPEGPKQWHSTLAFDATGRWIGLVRGSGIFILDATTGKVLHRLQGLANQPTVTSLSRNGEDLAGYVAGVQAMWRDPKNWRNQPRGWGTMLWHLSGNEPAPQIVRAMLPWSLGDDAPAAEQETMQFMQYHSRYMTATSFDIPKDPSKLTGKDYWNMMKFNVVDVHDTTHYGAAEQVVSRRDAVGDVHVWHADVSPDGTKIALALVNAKEVGDHFDDVESRKLPGTLELWDIHSAKKLWSAILPNSGSVVSFDNEGRNVYFGQFQFDAATGARLADRKLNAISPEQLAEYGAVSINGRKVNVRNESTCIAIYDWKTHELIAQLYWLNDEDWAVVTPSGLFDASEGAQQAMHFVVTDPAIGYELISLDQLKATYYVPGLLHKLFYQPQDVPKVGDFSVTLPPRVTTANSASPKLDLSIHERGGGIGRIEVRVNGAELLADARQQAPFDASAAQGKLSVDLSGRLHQGSNTVEIVTWNLEGNLRSAPVTSYLQVDAKGLVSRGSEPVEQPNGGHKGPSDFYAIISGIADYQGTKIDLRYSGKDAEDIARSVTLAARKYFCAEEMQAKKPCERVHVRLLSTETNKDSEFQGLADVPDFRRSDPVKREFADAFSDVAERSKPEDVVFVYMAGHGMSITSDQGVKESGFPDVYLYPTRDASTLDRDVMSNPTERDAKTVSSLELATWLSKVRSEKRVMILDTCAAGAVENDLIAQARSVDALQVRSLDRLRERSGFYILMGAAADAQSYEANEYRQGLLTYALIQAMTTDKGLREGHFLDVENWFTYAEDTVEDLARGVGGVQKPSFFKSKSSKSFDVGRIDAEEQRQLPLAQRVPLILKPELRSVDRTDKEHLSDQLEAKLIAESIATARGTAAPINYATIAANGLSPRGIYTVSGDNISVEISLIRDEVEVAHLKITGTREDIVAKVLAELIKSATSIRRT